MIHVPSGFYNDLDELFITMHELMDQLGRSNIKLALNRNTQKVKVKLQNNAFVEFHPELAAMLGFTTKSPGNGGELLSYRVLNTHEANLPIDLNAGMYSLYLYTDIIEDQLVGDAFAPLLRIVHMDKKGSGDVITRTYQSPHFVRVKMKHFDTITARIRRDTGEKIKFQRGKIVVKLCFRPVKIKYFKR
jgi:hypothetical protein